MNAQMQRNVSLLLLSLSSSSAFHHASLFLPPLFLSLFPPSSSPIMCVCVHGWHTFFLPARYSWRSRTVLASLRAGILGGALLRKGKKKKEGREERKERKEGGKGEREGVRREEEKCSLVRVERRGGGGVVWRQGRMVIG